MTVAKAQRNLLFVAVALVLLTCSGWTLSAPRPGKNNVVIRGQAQDVYFLPATTTGPHRKVLYAPGDGGWRGFGITIAERMASAGYDVYGLDTRKYLQSFANANLAPADIARDYRSLGEWARESSNDPILVVGWSEGAGLALAATAEDANRDMFRGVVVIGTTEQNILAWKRSDIWAEIKKTLPQEPTFASADYIGRVAPTPLFMIASSVDEYVTLQSTNQLFARAANPKRLIVIDADDHKYGGHIEELFRALSQGLQWVQTIR